MGSPKHLSTTPSEGFGPSRRQTTPPKPLRSPSEAHFKQPLREDGFQKTGFGRRHGQPQGQHFCAPRQNLSEGLVEGRTVTEGVG